MQGVPEVVLRSEQTNAEIGMIRHTVPVGFTGPPLHRHDFDETFYVLEGQLTVQLGEDLFRVETGELAFAPRGFPHTFTNLAERARALPDRVHPGGIRAPLRPHGGRARGRRPARLGARADPRGDRARRPDRPGRAARPVRPATESGPAEVDTTARGVAADDRRRERPEPSAVARRQRVEQT